MRALLVWVRPVAAAEEEGEGDAVVVAVAVGAETDRMIVACSTSHFFNLYLRWYKSRYASWVFMS